MFGLSAIENGIKHVGSFLAGAVGGLKKIAALWHLIQDNNTKALILKIASDVLLLVQETEAAAAAGGLNFVLDEEVFAAGKKLIADAEAGEGTIAADLAALGIKIPSAAVIEAAPAAVASVKVAAEVVNVPSPQEVVTGALAPA